MRDEFKNTDFWSKRFLPHYNAENTYQSITYRLADSIPQKVLLNLESQLEREKKSLKNQYSKGDNNLGAPHSDAENNNLGAPHSDAEIKNPGAPHSDAEIKKTLEIKKRILTETTLDLGYGSCLLGYDEIAEKKVQAWKYFDGERYDLISYVVMPNHVHLLIKTYPNFPVGDLVWSWKKYVSSFVYSQEKYKTKIKEFSLKESNSFTDKRFIKTASERGAPRLWQREYWDRFTRDENHFKMTIDYIHNNPVKAGLVTSQENWKWSSAGN